MRILNDLFKWFLYITVAILIVCAVIFSLSGMDSLPKETLWQILLSALLTACITVFLHLGDCNKKSTFVGSIFLHYIALCLIMIICGRWFGWLELNFTGIIMMLVAVAVVYLLAFLIHYMIDVKQAEKINQKLKEKYGDRE